MLVCYIDLSTNSVEDETKVVPLVTKMEASSTKKRKASEEEKQLFLVVLNA